MNASADEVAKEYSRAMVGELDDAITKIDHCMGQLSEEQLWWRPSNSMNSIANLILHLCGNVRQWIVAGVGGGCDTRVRQQEFDQRGGMTQTELKALLDQLAIDARQTLDAVAAENLLRPRVVQGFTVTGAEAIVQSIAHFRGHAQEIVHLTRTQLGDAYRFDFTPDVE